MTFLRYIVCEQPLCNFQPQSTKIQTRHECGLGMRRTWELTDLLILASR